MKKASEKNKTNLNKKEENENTTDKTLKEKKLKGNQKIALERIYRLFELAQNNNEYSKRYLQLAKRIGEKTRVSIPKELKEKYCKKCYSLNVKQTKKAPLLEVKCDECGFIKKFGIKSKETQKTQ